MPAGYCSRHSYTVGREHQEACISDSTDEEHQSFVGKALGSLEGTKILMHVCVKASASAIAFLF